MANYKVTDTELTALANSIRAKIGTQSLLEWKVNKGFADAVSDIDAYLASDEGKVVSNGELVAQTSQEITSNGTYDTTLVNQIVANISGGGGSANVLSGTSAPTANLGNDGSIYIQHNEIETYNVAGILSYLRTNNNTLDLILSNWLYRASDKFVLDYKNVGPHSNNWGTFIALPDTGKLDIHYNAYGYRSVINVKHNGTYSGDNNYAFDSITNVEKCYSIVLDGSNFSIMSALNRRDQKSTEISATIGTDDDTDIGNPILFPALNSSALNIEFHGLKVYRNGDLIHHYLPIQNGIIDIIDQTTFEISNANITYGSEISGPYESGIIINAYYKKSGAWQELIGTSIGDVNV